MVKKAFQLTRSRGAWLFVSLIKLSDLSNFNSHAHVERDIDLNLAKPKTIISTHTLTWSVTYATRSPLLSWLFQLTRSRGAWRIISSSYLRIYAFQLTRSRGAWLHLLRLNCKNLHFNSHAHVERDWDMQSVKLRSISFQLTRSRGAWRVKINTCTDYFTFQLTRSRGAWHMG